MSDKMREALKASECLYAWALSPNSQPIEKIVEKFQIVRATLTRQPESRAHEREIQKLLERRDELETICDQLAARVAELTGIDIGEHSSANCPWTNALEAPDKPITDPLNEQPESEPVAWMCRHPNGRWDKPVRSKEYAETILKSWQEHNPHVHLVPLVPAGSVLPKPSVQVPERIQELAERLVSAGPKCCAVSVSECHEISDFIRDLPAGPAREVPGVVGPHDAPERFSGAMPICVAWASGWNECRYEMLAAPSLAEKENNDE